jgi:glycerol uptake facilitator-like aquaporin
MTMCAQARRETAERNEDTQTTFTFPKRVATEAIATGLLLAIVVGSGIMGDRLSGGNVAIALLANTIATGAGLVALILTFGHVSGAHMNPAVTIAAAFRGQVPFSEVPGYVIAQITGAFVGVAAAHVMFGEPMFSFSLHARAGAPQLLSEGLATFGLLSVIWGCSKARASAVPFAVGAFITAAYWFTSSTSFANPAVTLARAVTNTFAGIRPADVPGFLVAQTAGAIAATVLFTWLERPHRTHAKRSAFTSEVRANATTAGNPAAGAVPHPGNGLPEWRAPERSVETSRTGGPS